MEKIMKLELGTVFCFEGNVFVVADDDDGIIYLCLVAKDNSNYEKGLCFYLDETMEVQVLTEQYLLKGFEN